MLSWEMWDELPAIAKLAVMGGGILAFFLLLTPSVMVAM